MSMTTTQPRRRRQRGSAIIEFALGSFVLMGIFTGTFEFGYTFYIYNNLQTAVNNGAKYAALRPYEPTTATPEACFQTAVQNMVAYGDPSGTTTTPVAPGITPSKVALTVTFAKGVPSAMTVGITGYTLNAVVAKFTLTNKPQATYPYLGRYAGGNGETCVK
jgi:Flp pilus assembly protein TadG